MLNPKEINMTTEQIYDGKEPFTFKKIKKQKELVLDLPIQPEIEKNNPFEVIKQLIDNKQYLEAKSILYNLEQNDPNNTELLYWLGKASIENWYESERQYRKILKLEPNNIRALLALPLRCSR